MINFINVEIFVQNKDRATRSSEKRIVFFDIWTIETIVFSNLSTKYRKAEQLIIDWQVKFFLFLVKVIIRWKWVLNISLNCNFFLAHNKQISLVNGKLVFWDFIDTYRFVFSFDNVVVVDLLICHTSWFMNKPNVVIFVSYNNCVEIREKLKILYYFVCGEDSYTRGGAASVQRKYGYVFLDSTQIKLVLFVWIFEMLNLLMMSEFFKS